MRFKNTLKSAIILVGLNGTLAYAESPASAVIDDSLRQFPAGSLDRAPSGGSPLSETLRMDVTDTKTITIEFESFSPAAGQSGSFKPAPLKLELQQIPTLNRTKNIFEFELKLGGSTYASYAELKAAMSKFPKGTEITWGPGCFRVGGGPIDAHWKEFEDLCKKLGVVLVVIPSD